ncbi:sensor histidine kinase [bacterium]|nr:sensor histidine kinase [bacterium]
MSGLGNARLCAAVLICMGLGSSFAPGVVVPVRAEVGELERPAAERHLPYTVEAVQEYSRHPGDLRSFAFERADFDGDGHDELITSNGTHLLGLDGEDTYLRTLFQINLEPDWRFDNNIGSRMAVCRDLSGDGVDEFYTTIRRDDRSAWRFVGIDLADGSFRLDVPLPLGADRRADGVWDGTYQVIGWVDDADGKGTPAVILCVIVQYDATGRGIMAVDPRDGHEVWRWETGVNPDRVSAHVADLEGDGRPEIVLFGTSPDNLGGQLVNGMSDDRAVFVVLSADGNVLWVEDVAGDLQHGRVDTHDLTGDGKLEIIVSTAAGKVGETHRLAVWDYESRSVLVAQRQRARFLGLAVVPGDRPGVHWLYTGSNDGYVTRFICDGRTLTRDRSVLTGAAFSTVIGAVDVLPAPGPEILVDGVSDGLLVLDTGLRPLAAHTPEASYGRAFPCVLRVGEADSLLVLGSDGGQALLSFAKTPFALPARVAYAVVALLVAALLVVAFRLGRASARRPGGASAVEPAPVADLGADREVLYRIWRQLDDVKHERFLEVNHGLRRLVWLLEAYAADLGASEDLRERIGQLLEDFTDSLQPRLLEILRLARDESYEPDLVETTAEALRVLGGLLSGLEKRTLSVASVQACTADMKSELGRVEEGFTELWRSLRRYFSTDPVRMIQGMLLLREVEFQRAGVGARFLGAASGDDLVCLIDSGSLRYVLDNLVNNALRAMAESDRRELIVEASRADREVTLRLTDTGKGIEPEARERIFNGRTSDRLGGGTGLFRSRQILQKWGGEISLAGSAPGQGTTFVVQLRAAHAAAAAEEPPQALSGEA